MRRRAIVKKRRPDRLSKVFFCEAVISPLEEHLRTTGLEHREEAGLIAGYIIGSSIGIGTTVLLPYTENTSVACALPIDITMGCIETVNRTGQVVLAQVHTHPGRVCGHSCTDDKWAFSDCPGLFSLVVPCFGRFGIRNIFTDGVAVYERLTNGKWYRLPPSEVRQRFFIVPNYRVII
jgi:hypothetical protein